MPLALPASALPAVQHLALIYDNACVPLQNPATGRARHHAALAVQRAGL